MINDFILLGAKQLSKYKNKLADEYDHLFHVCIADSENKVPCLSYFVDEQGRVFKTISAEPPKKVMSCLYPVDIDFKNELSDEYELFLLKNNKVANKVFYSGIVQSPFKFYPYILEGDERLIKKMKFKEKLNGEKNLSFDEIIDEDTFEQIMKKYKIISDNIYYHPYLDKIHIVFLLPKNIDIEKRGLMIEISRCLKNKILKNFDFLETSYKMPDMNLKDPALCAFKLRADYIKNIDFEDIYKSMINEIRKVINYIDDIDIGGE
ncbi:DUF4895 domain-containing protein [Oceanotoga teriensis]|jgi:hypothetical protein|uniref:Uncharacterized protein DUF4895 n=1 Tax=Oceanotoga teriensis TaxID=515440 RepID=A0AA45HHK5_9BACT|nr:DUF4895 domain-containing protein [Oceanotoga teriensis]MDO7976923.1 DUF4895 domain-containing protein [Oceanotoga teriensis]PWJ87412.1 uncharacterized protein DUF4895 [Oceanotoga teriensis]